MEKEKNTPRRKRLSPKRIIPLILVLVLVGGIIFGVKEYLYYQHFVTTDDAQIDGDISPVVARVGGYVREIRFQDNQRVQAGDTLVVLDDRDYRLQLEQAEAAIEAARQNRHVSEAAVLATRAGSATARANVAAAQAKLWEAEQQYNRYKNLYDQQAITKAQFDAVTTEKTAAEAALQAAKSQEAVILRQIGTSRQQVGVAASRITVEEAAADVARLQLSYTVITAPVSGIVSKRNIQLGQLVQAGQSMFAIVIDSNLYVTANFKETQLAQMQPGQPVEVDVDAFPDHPFQGRVESFSGATGAKFSLLPPDNATGNFVKVVQRMPVRIALPELPADWRAKLRPGLSVNVKVKVK